MVTLEVPLVMDQVVPVGRAVMKMRESVGQSLTEARSAGEIRDLTLMAMVLGRLSSQIDEHRRELRDAKKTRKQKLYGRGSDGG